MINKITNWSEFGYIPTEEGMYLASFGDLETDDNVYRVIVSVLETLPESSPSRIQYQFFDSNFCSTTTVNIGDLVSGRFICAESIKWAKIVFRPSEVSENE